MVDIQTVVSLLPHYLAMLVLVFLGVGVLRTAVSGVNLIAEFVLILGIVFLYPFVVRRLGYAPEMWE
jgi:hypothetical protein